MFLRDRHLFLDGKAGRTEILLSLAENPTVWVPTFSADGLVVFRSGLPFEQQLMPIAVRPNTVNMVRLVVVRKVYDDVVKAIFNA